MDANNIRPRSRNQVYSAQDQPNPLHVQQARSHFDYQFNHQFNQARPTIQDDMNAGNCTTLTMNGSENDFLQMAPMSAPDHTQALYSSAPRMTHQAYTAPYGRVQLPYYIPPPLPYVDPRSLSTNPIFYNTLGLPGIGEGSAYDDDEIQQQGYFPADLDNLEQEADVQDEKTLTGIQAEEAETEEKFRAEWDEDIQSLADARNWQEQRATEPLKVVGEDDVAEATEKKLQSSKDLLAAIIHASTEVNAKKQESRLDDCKKLLKTPDQIKDACANVLEAVQCAIDIHVHGIPVNRLEPPLDRARRFNKTGGGVRVEREIKVLKMRKGFVVDQTTNCTTRIKTIINYAKRNKFVAYDVLEGDRFNILNLVCAPDDYFKRKDRNLSGNEKKAAQIKEGRTVLEQKGKDGEGHDDDHQDDEGPDDAETQRGEGQDGKEEEVAVPKKRGEKPKSGGKSKDGSASKGKGATQKGGKPKGKKASAPPKKRRRMTEPDNEYDEEEDAAFGEDA